MTGHELFELRRALGATPAEFLAAMGRPVAAWEYQAAEESGGRPVRPKIADAARRVAAALGRRVVPAGTTRRRCLGPLHVQGPPHFFLSRGPGHRVCAECKASDVWKAGGGVYDPPGRICAAGAAE